MTRSAWKVALGLLAVGCLLLTAQRGAGPVAEAAGADAAAPAPGAARAATLAYMHATGQKQGEIKGSVTQKGREGTIAITSVEHEIVSPRDAASGLPTGKRMHKPLTIRKEYDRSTPLFMRTLVTNETLPEVTLRFYRPDAGGTEKPYYTIRLTNAMISSVQTATAPGATAPVEAISFTYQKIEWTWTDGGITASDDWEAPTT